MATKKAPKRKAVPAGDRMRFLRRKAADGTADESELAELESLVTPKDKPLDQIFSDEPGANSITEPPEPEQQELPVIGAAVVTDGSTVNGVPPPPMPPPPAVPHRLKAFIGKIPAPGQGPRVEREQPKAGKASEGNWKQPYLDAAKGAGREASVLFIASRWIGALEMLSNSIRSVGVDPLVDVMDPSVRAMIVLTVDDYLPAQVVLKPVHMSAFATTSILGQTFYHRKAIAAKDKVSKDAVDMKTRIDARKAEQDAAESRPTPAPVDAASVPSPPKPDVVPVAVSAVPVNGTNSSPVQSAVTIAGLPKLPYSGPAALDPDDVH